MKFRCERDVLAEALTTAGRAVSTRSAGLPALGGIQFRATGNELHLVGTDLDLTMQITVPVVVMSEGTCVIPARLITDIVRALPEGAAVVEAEAEEARISAGRSQFSVRTLNAEEFPKIVSNDNFTATLQASELTEALRQVVRAASSDDSRPVLTGVLMSSEDSGLRLVATDSYRLAIRDIPGAQIFQADQSVLIPSKALSELGRLLSGAEEVKVALEDRELSFLVGNVRLTSRLIEGQFPDYRPLLPSSYPNRLHIDRDLLAEAVKRVKLLVRDSTTPVRLALRPDGVELTVVSQEVGSATDDVEAKYEGEAITVAFNPAYLIDGLDAVPPGDVLIETIDALKPATLKAEENSDFLYLIMPVRVS
jgi:DNA polymerase III subunit beta